MEEASVIKNGVAITPSKTIEKGVVVFQDGEITAVGQRNRVKVPKSARATINPAVVINVDETKGSLEPGKDADIVIIDDEINVYTTIVKGDIACTKSNL